MSREEEILSAMNNKCGLLPDNERDKFIIHLLIQRLVITQDMNEILTNYCKAKNGQR